MSRNSLMPLTRGRARVFWAPGLALALLSLLGCDAKRADDNASNTYVFAIEMRGEQGDDIFSDVCGADPDNPGVCTVFNDNAVVAMQATSKNQTALTEFDGLQDIIIRRYRVTYVRSDGRNVPGVDVPYPFDGVMTFRVPISGQPQEHSFMIVRHQAKLEEPLSTLSEGGGAFVLSTLARVDFFGEDVAGRAVTVTAWINVSFADFPDDNL